jgi:hypothetical protein
LWFCIFFFLARVQLLNSFGGWKGFSDGPQRAITGHSMRDVGAILDKYLARLQWAWSAENYRLGTLRVDFSHHLFLQKRRRSPTKLLY